MWLVSMSAALESRVKYKKQIRELEGKVKKMEEERMSLLNAMNATAAVSSSTVEKVQTHAETEIVEPDFTQREENDKQ